jgi:hypothetical protein
MPPGSEPHQSEPFQIKQLLPGIVASVVLAVVLFDAHLADESRGLLPTVETSSTAYVPLQPDFGDNMPHAQQPSALSDADQAPIAQPGKEIYDVMSDLGVPPTRWRGIYVWLGEQKILFRYDILAYNKDGLLCVARDSSATDRRLLEMAIQDRLDQTVVSGR